MQSCIGLIAFAVILSLGVAIPTYAAGETAAPRSQTVRGELMKIEGEFYTVHDTARQEIRLHHVDKTTKLEGAFKAGDKVEIQVTDKNHALSMKSINTAK